MWEYICPKCRKGVKQNAHECPHCGERFPLAVRVPPTFLKDPKKLEEYVHKHIFPRVSEFERNYLTKYFTVLLSDGFESGTILTTDVPPGAWDVIAGTPTIVTSPVHHGVYACQINATSEYAYKTLASTYDTLYARAYIRFSSLPTTSGQYIDCIGISPAGFPTYPSIMRVQHDGTDVKCFIRDLYAATSGAYGSTIFIVNTLYLVEIKYDRNVASTLYINGVQETTHTVGSLYAQTVILSRYLTAGVSITDCVVIADTYIGPEVAPKGTIAIHAKLAGII